MEVVERVFWAVLIIFVLFCCFGCIFVYSKGQFLGTLSGLWRNCCEFLSCGVCRDEWRRIERRKSTRPITLPTLAIPPALADPTPLPPRSVTPELFV